MVTRPSRKYSIERIVSAVVLCVSAIVVAVELLPTSTEAQERPVGAISIEYERTVLSVATGERTVEERGRYVIAPDGRYRVDKIRDGVRTAQIVDWQQRRRIALNIDRQEAVIGSMNALVLPPSAGPQPVPGAPSGWTETDGSTIDLGTKTVNGVQLIGRKKTSVLRRAGRRERSHTSEVWFYQPPDPRYPPIMIELLFDSPEEVHERRMVRATETQVPAEFFGVPPDFDVVRRIN